MEIRNLGLGDKTQRGLAYSKLSMDNSSINWYSGSMVSCHMGAVFHFQQYY